MELRNHLRIRSPLPDKVSQTAARQLVLVMVLLCYHLWFQVDFACPCSPQRDHTHCYSYMVLPCLFVTAVLVCVDGRTGRIFRYGCYHSSLQQRRCHVKSACEVLTGILQAASSGFLWCASVLVAGNWYLCCASPKREGLIPACWKNVSEVGTADWEEKVRLRNQSLVSETPPAPHELSGVWVAGVIGCVLSGRLWDSSASC